MLENILLVNWKILHKVAQNKLVSLFVCNLVKIGRC